MTMAGEKALDMLILWGLKQGRDYNAYIDEGGDWKDHVYPYALHLAKLRMREYYYPKQVEVVAKPNKVRRKKKES